MLSVINYSSSNTKLINLGSHSFPRDGSDLGAHLTLSRTKKRKSSRSDSTLQSLPNIVSRLQFSLTSQGFGQPLINSLY